MGLGQRHLGCLPIMELELAGVQPRIGGVSGRDNIKSVNFCLKGSTLVISEILTGIQFHNRGPMKPNEFSKRVFWPILPLLAGRILAVFPNLALLINWISRSLDVRSCLIFQMCMIKLIMYLSLRRCTDIGESDSNVPSNLNIINSSSESFLHTFKFLNVRYFGRVPKRRTIFNLTSNCGFV